MTHYRQFCSKIVEFTLPKAVLRPSFWLLSSLTIALLGCSTPSPRAPNLAEPGWAIRQGQAVWKPAGARPELAGELLLAVRGQDEMFLQFSKTPFPLVTANSTPESWQIEFAAQKPHYSGRGQPPSAILWFILQPTLDGRSPPKPWIYQPTPQGWRIENPRTQEWLEGYLQP